MKSINLVKLHKLRPELRSKWSRTGLLFALLLLICAGCKQKYPGDILTPEEMKPVLFDVMLASEIKQMDTSAITKLHIRDSITYEIHRVLAAHKVDDSLYFRSMAFYEAHPDYLKALLDSTKVYGNMLQDSLQKQQFTQPDSLPKPKILNARDKPAIAAHNLPVNPTVKDSGAVPVTQVKKPLKK